MTTQWLLYLVSTLLIALIYIFLGTAIEQNPSGSLAAAMGLRKKDLTAPFIQNEKARTWAQRLYGTRQKKGGFGLAVLAIAGMLCVFNQSDQAVMIAGAILFGLELLFFFGLQTSCAKAVRKHFPELLSCPQAAPNVQGLSAASPENPDIKMSEAARDQGSHEKEEAEKVKQQVSESAAATTGPEMAGSERTPVFHIVQPALPTPRQLPTQSVSPALSSPSPAASAPTDSSSKPQPASRKSIIPGYDEQAIQQILKTIETHSTPAQAGTLSVEEAENLSFRVRSSSDPQAQTTGASSALSSVDEAEAILQQLEARQGARHEDTSLDESEKRKLSRSDRSSRAKNNSFQFRNLAATWNNHSSHLQD